MKHHHVLNDEGAKMTIKQHHHFKCIFPKSPTTSHLGVISYISPLLGEIIPINDFIPPVSPNDLGVAVDVLKKVGRAAGDVASRRFGHDEQYGARSLSRRKVDGTLIPLPDQVQALLDATSVQVREQEPSDSEVSDRRNSGA